MAISDRILLRRTTAASNSRGRRRRVWRPRHPVLRRLHGQQQPPERPASPKSATARARLEGQGWALRGKRRRRACSAGQDAIGVIRVEQVRPGRRAPGQPRVDMRLMTSMYLGDCWECRLPLPGEDRSVRWRCAPTARKAAPAHARITRRRCLASQVWIFPAAGVWRNRRPGARALLADSPRRRCAAHGMRAAPAD